MLKNYKGEEIFGYVKKLGYDSKTKTLELHFDGLNVEEEEIRKIEIDRVAFIWKKKEKKDE